MPVNYNFKRGTDLPSWHWLNQFFGGNSYGGAANAYDGTRFIYWAIQFGTTSNGTASTTQLWRYDTWTNGWQYITGLANAEGALDMEYDGLRGVLWILEATGTTSVSWRYFNCNTSPVTLGGLTTPAFTLSSTIAVVLPAAQSGSQQEGTIETVNDADVPAQFPINRDVVTSTLGGGANTTTSISDPNAEFHSGMIGLAVRLTSGTQSGQTRIITAVPNPTTLTVVAFGAAPALTDTYQIEVPGGFGATGWQASGGSVTTIGAAAAGFPVNQYRDADVIIVSGTGAGQRRRIGSNDATTLTLAAAVAGNPRTGNWTTAPAADSTFRIVPSSDFVYYMPGNAVTLYRADVVATTLVWATLTGAPGTAGGGTNMFWTPFHAPFSLLFFRGGGTNNVYRYDIGLTTWTTLASLWGSETLNVGGTVARIPYRSKFFVHIQSSNRCYLYNPSNGMLEPFPSLPYAAPGGYSGKRARFIRTADGIDFLYMLRAGGAEFWRLPVEWL